jgi:PIN domain nuclease of toxin-antitoxin system
MSRGILLDTHVWLWFFAQSGQIPTSALERLALAANADELYIAAYSLFEAVYLVQKNRILIHSTIEVWLNRLLDEPSVKIIPLTPAVALATTLLPSDFHGDPGDRLIAASAVAQRLTLCTHDGAMLRFGRQGAYDYLEV